MSANLPPLVSLHKSGIPTSKPPIVIVRPNDKNIQYSVPLNQTGELPFNKQDTEELADRQLFTIQESTNIVYTFNGTGVAVVGVTHDSFPPVPSDFTPSWKCLVDDRPIDQPNTPLYFPSSSDQPDIPDDGKKRMCQVKNLSSDKEHKLEIRLGISKLPAFFHSIRYRPLQSNNSLNLNNSFLRIDSGDQSRIHYDQHSWEVSKYGTLQPTKPNRGGYLNITFEGDSLQWFGYLGGHHNNVHLEGGQLDDQPIMLDVTNHHHKPLFTVKVLDNNTRSSHTLAVPARQYDVELDHALVTIGHPPTLALASGNNVISPQQSMLPTSGSKTPVGPIAGGVAGFLLLVLVILLSIWYTRRRRQRNTWKDSAYPSLITHPASRVSSRSSFSREVVTGDIEYNPEAQKKLDNVLIARLTEPPPAVVLHADSGVRFIRASQVPPHYTHI